MARCNCKHCERRLDPRSLPSGCSTYCRDSNSRRSSHGPCIHSRNRCRHSTQYAEPNSRRAIDRLRYPSPTTAESKARQCKGPVPRHREPSSSRRSRSSRNQGSKRNRRQGREAGRTRAEAAEALTPPPAVRRRHSDRNFDRSPKRARNFVRTKLLVALARNQIDRPMPSSRWRDRRSGRY